MTITKLTKEQEKQIPAYIDKWVKKASEPMNHEKAIKYTREMYKTMGKKEPLVIFGLSPMNTSLLCALFFSLVKDKGFSSGSQLASQLRSQLASQLRSQLASQLRSQLDSQLGSQLVSQLHSQLASQLYSQLASQLRSQLKEINSHWYLSLWWLVWCGWYDYGKFIGVKFDEEKYDLFMNFISEVSFIIPYENVVFISEKPVEICWKNKMLHNDNGMAVRYSDNYGIWCLNGVRVTQELVETPHDKLNPKIILKEKNAEVRREIVRKIGIERICKELTAKVLDKKDNYELLDLNLGDRTRPYLKMRNPSIGVYHIEGVHPNCRTVEQALNWRNGTKEKPEVLT